MLLVAAPAMTRAAEILPDRVAIQRAYDDASSEPETAARHVPALSIEAARCNVLGSGPQFVCQIDFVRRDEPQGRLYFDVVTVERRIERWTLLSGLCKSRPALP